MTTKVHIHLPLDAHAQRIDVFALSKGAHLAQGPQLLATVERGGDTEQFVHYEQDLLIREGKQ